LQLLSPNEVTARTGLSRATLAKWRVSRQGPSYCKLGAKVAYPEAALNDWLAANLQQTEARS
jgi:predicted DNA-binding transcriptional regulator AlpA